jgi:hypothetical protein
MKNQFYILLLILLVSSTIAFSQEELLTRVNSDNFISQQENLNILNNINLNQYNSASNLRTSQENAILIKQIGNYNRIYSQTQSESSDIRLVQLGDFNEIDLSINAPSINGKIIQNGNSNTVLNSIYYTNLDVSVNSLQNGNNLTINKIGINSLSNKLQLVQEGSFKTITVISN